MYTHQPCRILSPSEEQKLTVSCFFNDCYCNLKKGKDDRNVPVIQPQRSGSTQWENKNSYQSSALFLFLLAIWRWHSAGGADSGSKNRDRSFVCIGVHHTAVNHFLPSRNWSSWSGAKQSGAPPTEVHIKWVGGKNLSVKRFIHSLQNLLEVLVRTVLFIRVGVTLTFIHLNYRSEFWLRVLPSVRTGNLSLAIEMSPNSFPHNPLTQEFHKNCEMAGVLTLFIRISDPKKQTLACFSRFYLELSV